MNVEKYTELPKSNLKVFGDIVLIVPLVKDSKIVTPDMVHAKTQGIERPFGRVVNKGEKVVACNVGDIVHFATYPRYELLVHDENKYVVLRERDLIGKEVTIEQPEVE